MGACGAERASGATGYLSEQEVALMRRIISLVTVAALMAAMVVVTAAPALAKPGGNGWGYGYATGPTWGYGTDADGDGLKRYEDNCPNNHNTNQANRDGDGTGDACDPYPDDRTK
jgi:hypothetical protein